MKVRIIRLSKEDCHYGMRKDLLGLTGEFEISAEYKDKWIGGFFTPDKTPYGWEHLPTICFYHVKFEILEK